MVLKLKKNSWKESIGKAYFVDDKTVGALKVSFFGPFYGGYNVIKLDEDYTTALVAGPNKKYLWLLSKKPCISENVKNAYVKTAKDNGFDTNLLMFGIQTDKNCQ